MLGDTFVLFAEVLGAIIGAAVLMLAVLFGWFFITPPEYD